jgi:hypothetical protein
MGAVGVIEGGTAGPADEEVLSDMRPGTWTRKRGICGRWNSSMGSVFLASLGRFHNYRTSP